MRVYEVIKKADKKEVAKHLKNTYSDYYETTKEAMAAFIIFKEEMKKFSLPAKLKPSEEDLLVFIMKTYGDSEVCYKEDNPTEFDFEKNVWYHVDGMHAKDYIKYQDEIGLTYKEIEQKRQIKHDDFLHTYGLDLMDRDVFLSLNVASIVFDYYDFNLIAAELFWELTFYGLFNETTEDKQKEMTDSFDEAMENIKKSMNPDGTRNEEEFSKHFVTVDTEELFKNLPEHTEEEKAFSDQANELTQKASKKIQKEYYEKYKAEIEAYVSIRTAKKFLKENDKRIKTKYLKDCDKKEE